MKADILIFAIYTFSCGIVVAFVLSLITKALYGKLIDALVKNDCESENSAKSFEELGVKNNFFIDFSMKKNRALSRLVQKSEDGKLFLPPENKLKAQSLYGSERISPLTIAVIVLLFVAVVLVCRYVIPFVMN